MAIQVTKDSIDLGIVCNDIEKMLSFYTQALGLEKIEVLGLPGGAKLHRLQCGTSWVKLVEPASPPAARAAPGGIAGATGMRYFTISVADLDGLTSGAKEWGATVAVPVTEFRPGVRISIIEDPDGNWVELLDNKA
jgi:predicted enzyme related to lactoylglutathione lyase